MLIRTGITLIRTGIMLIRTGIMLIRTKDWDNADKDWDNADKDWDNADKDWDNADKDRDNADKDRDNADKGVDNVDKDWDNTDKAWDNADKDWDNADKDWDNADKNWNNSDKAWDNADKAWDNADKAGSSRDEAPWDGSSCARTMAKIPEKRREQTEGKIKGEQARPKTWIGKRFVHPQTFPGIDPIFGQPKISRDLPKKTWENCLWNDLLARPVPVFPGKQRPWKTLFRQHLPAPRPISRPFPRLSRAWCRARGIFCSQIPLVLQCTEKGRKTGRAEPRNAAAFPDRLRKIFHGQGMAESLFSCSCSMHRNV
ncbi:hypothetical protein DUI87_35029 [Hirundo rustica rustica]|uniref:Uncharacterized protein n=1 Tax=Hirundo rustica rustica TaxID=333673 RepID=A0A3M0IJL8_HIRRU|nr:hypothetical protein DUI87_35029 [Hirundo rustica rustica]